MEPIQLTDTATLAELRAKLQQAFQSIVATDPLVAQFRAAFDARASCPWLPEANDEVAAAVTEAVCLVLLHVGWTTVREDVSEPASSSDQTAFWTLVCEAVAKMHDKRLWRHAHDLHGGRFWDWRDAAQMREAIVHGLKTYANRTAARCGMSADPW